jgi:hypothetical protein
VADLASFESLGKQLQIYSYLKLNTWILVVPEYVGDERFVAHGGDLQANNLRRISVVAIPFQPLARDVEVEYTALQFITYLGC